jgi:hypothetical protein
LGLLGFELELQNPMVEKIWGLMAKIAHRAILDMHSLGVNKQLEYMWCSSSTRRGDRLALKEVLHLPTNTPSFILFMLHIPFNMPHCMP